MSQDVVDPGHTRPGQPDNSPRARPQIQVRRFQRLVKRNFSDTPRFVVIKPHLMRPTTPATSMAGVGTGAPGEDILQDPRASSSAAIFAGGQFHRARRAQLEASYVATRTSIRTAAPIRHCPDCCDARPTSALPGSKCDMAASPRHFRSSPQSRLSLTLIAW